MENAADALKMAAAVLIFILALSISINAFGQVRRTSQIILDYKDREYDYTYVEENKDNNGIVSTERWVGIETIIPSIYKAYKENYKIVFEFGDNTVLYKKKNSKSGEPEGIKYIDLQENKDNKLGLAGENQKREFIQAILYGSKGNYGDKNWITIQKQFGDIGITFVNNDGIYPKIKEQKYKESLGEYYQEEVQEKADEGNSQSVSSPNTNKTKKRIITYSSN